MNGIYSTNPSIGLIMYVTDYLVCPTLSFACEPVLSKVGLQTFGGARQLRTGGTLLLI